MHLLHVYKDFDPPIAGGIEGHMARMCRVQRAWANVEALTCSRTCRTRVVERDGTRVTEAAEWGRFQNAPMAPTFPALLRRMARDVAVIHAPFPTGELSWLLARPRARLVVRYHSDVVRQATAMRVYGPLQRMFLERADCILPTSRQYLDTSPMLAAVRDRCRVIPLGIDTAAFDRPSEEGVAALRAKYGQYVLFAGRHRYYKGLRVLVEAAQAIRASVVAAGDGPERDACRRLAEERGVRMFFPGTLTHQELVDHLHGCEAFVFPSIARSEAFGIALLEAHACGKPAVATTLGTGVEFVNRHGETGLNAPPGDPHALAEAVNALLDDATMRDRMGRTARERVRTEFTMEQIARREFEVFEELMETGASASPAPGGD